MKPRIFTYSAKGLDENLLDKQAQDLKYLSKKSFKQAVNNGLEYRIAGKTRLKEAEDKDDGRLLVFGGKKYRLEKCTLTRIVGYIPVGDGSFVEYRQSLIPLLLLLAAILAAAICCVLLLNRKAPAEILTPDYELTEEDEYQISLDDVISADFMMVINLPQGDIEVNSPILSFENEQLRLDGKEYQKEAFSGNLHMTAYMYQDGQEYLVFDDGVTLTNGELQGAFIDYLIQKTELIAGAYSGRILLDYGNSNKLESSLGIIIRNRAGGSMGITFSDEVNIDRASGSVTMEYSEDIAASHDTIVQLILTKGEEEILLAQSGVVKPGHALEQMKLLDGVAQTLTPGGYFGNLRLNFYALDRDEAITDLYTNIAVKIYVH